MKARDLPVSMIRETDTTSALRSYARSVEASRSITCCAIFERRAI